ncbi:hypothetical protein QQ045_002915 [Rhodiola kirilowii]
MESCSIFKPDGRGSLPLLPLLSSALEKIIHKNEYMFQAGKVRDVVTIFHSSKVPPLGIRQYLVRIFKYSRCSPSCLVLAFIYMNWFCQRTKICLSSLNVHRLLITSILVAAKFFDNWCLNNAYYAKVGGVGTQELNKMEMKLLFDLDFRLYVSPQVFNRYCLLLEKEDGAKAYSIEQSIHIHRSRSFQIQE